MPKTEEKEVKSPPKEGLEKGQVSIVVDGNEVVFSAGQEDLPGMPEMTRLRQLAGAYVKKSGEVAEEQDLLQKVNQEIMMELRNEGRSGFAFREGGSTYVFAINAPEEKLVVKRKKQ